jgi:glutamate synthase domain-containing protein 3
MLEDWERLLQAGAFVKVMPHDYKRVLRELAEEEEEQAEGVPA